MLRLWLALSVLFLILNTANALHFYLDAGQRRCFIEELPADTVVEGRELIHDFHITLQLCTGHYRALEWAQAERTYQENRELGIAVEVEVGFCLIQTVCPLTMASGGNYRSCRRKNHRTI
jgi:hypothetical protein